jgi:hypothetical protein
MYNPISQDMATPFYYVHSAHGLDTLLGKDVITILSVDPARDNYAFRIERRYVRGSTVETLAFERVGFLTGQAIYSDVIKFLDSYYYAEVDLVLVEKQPGLSAVIDNVATITLTYFILLSKSRPMVVISVNSKLKKTILGRDKLTSRQLKARSVAKAHALLTRYKDEKGLSIMRRYTDKEDDLADTVCQIEAFLLLVGIIR